MVNSNLFLHQHIQILFTKVPFFIDIFILHSLFQIFSIIAHGKQSVKAKRTNQFCERGGQMVFIQLNESVKKSGMQYFSCS